MLRRGFIAIGLIELAAALTFACSSFSSSEESAVTTPGDAADELASDAFTPPDTAVPDAAPPVCTQDAASVTPPSGDLTAYVCGAATKNLLGDPQNCGWCGHECLDAPVCTNGMCQPLALVTGPVNASLELERADDDVVYWVDQSRVPSALFKASSSVPSDESVAAKIVEVDVGESVNTQVFGMAIGERIFLHTYTRLLHAPFDGGPLTVFSTMSAGNSVTPLVTSGPHLFQTSYEGTGTFVDFVTADAAVRSRQTNVAFALDLAATPDGRFAFIIGRKAADAGSLVDGSAATRGALYRYTVATKDLTRVAELDAMDAPGSVLVADDAFVYFPEGLTGSILRFPVDAPFGTAPTLLSKGDGRMVRQIALDEGRVYWLSSPPAAAPEYYNWDLSSVDKCGGGDFAHVAGSAGQSFYPRGMAATKTHLYWASRNNVFRVAK